MKLLILLICAALGLSGCATRYAVVHVDVKADASISHELYSAKDGMYLGDTPCDLFLSKYSMSDVQSLSLLVKKGTQIRGWQIVEVSHWAPNPALAHDAAYRNSVLFLVPTGN